MVGSFVQLLDRRYGNVFDDQARQHIAYAVDGAKRMQELINALLDYSRVGNQELFERTDSSRAVRTATVNLRIAIEETGASVVYDSLPMVWADNAQLVQLFQNLFANAIKFRSNEPPRIRVSAEQRDGYWQFAVQDNGIGIEPRHAERIFVIFQRLHNRTDYPGTGIGLALCKKIVERHRGRIWVESQAGKGATFYFTIPDRPGSSEYRPKNSEVAAPAIAHSPSPATQSA
jgi:light-regulated signal transduction histidine kinase (bacteriophytochrome)